MYKYKILTRGERMMRKGKKVLALVVSLMLMCGAVMPTSLFAQSEERGGTISGFINPDVSSSNAKIKEGIKIEVEGSGSTAVTNNEGFFTVNVINASSKVSLVVSKVNYLFRTISDVQVGAQVGSKAQPVVLWPGDNKKDNAINMADIVELLKYYNSSAGNPKYNADFDYNMDNAINMQDVTIVVKNFNKTASNYPAPIITIPNTQPPTTIKPTDTPTPTTTTNPPTLPPAGKKIIGYLASWEMWTADDVQGDKMTHVNFAFANCVNGEVVIGEPEGDPTKLAELQKVKQKYPHLKTLVSVGGWTWSKGFHDAAMTDVSREKFATTAIKYMLDYGFDGVDIDWEYPNQKGDGNPFGPEDKHNFTLMLQKMREKLDAQGKADGKYYELSIATGANETYAQNTELDIIQNYLDQINIMTYDFSGTWVSKTSHHTNLYNSKLAPNGGISADTAVKIHKKYGVPSNKIVLGVAFYGTGFKKVGASTNNGLNQSFSGGIGATYSQIKNTYLKKPGYVRYWDNDAKAPYIFSDADKVLISYDDPESLKAKSDYVKANDMGGIMFWEYCNDADGELLDTLYNELK